MLRIALAARKSPAPDGPQTRARRRAPPRQPARGQGILDAMGWGVILVSPERHILLVNKIGDTVLKRGDGLVINKNLLACHDGASLTRLARAIAGAAGGYRAGSLLLERPGSAPPYHLTITPSGPGTSTAALILFHDPDAGDPSLQGRLRTLFALTAAEADLAVALSQGASLTKIAGQRAVSASTVRSQIKSIAAKMRCNRQAEIAAIVARLPPLPPRGS